VSGPVEFLDLREANERNLDRGLSPSKARQKCYYQNQRFGINFNPVMEAVMKPGLATFLILGLLAILNSSHQFAVSHAAKA
jgi:hypothetical protein